MINQWVVCIPSFPSDIVKKKKKDKTPVDSRFFISVVWSNQFSAPAQHPEPYTDICGIVCDVKV